MNRLSSIEFTTRSSAFIWRQVVTASLIKGSFLVQLKFVAEAFKLLPAIGAVVCKFGKEKCVITKFRLVLSMSGNSCKPCIVCFRSLKIQYCTTVLPRPWANIPSCGPRVRLVRGYYYSNDDINNNGDNNNVDDLNSDDNSITITTVKIIMTRSAKDAGY